MRSATALYSEIIIFSVLLLLSSPASGSQGGWADHPALTAFDISGIESHHVIYLVRTPGSLPQTEGVEILSQADGLFLVAGDETSVMGLVELGFGVFPLEKPSSDQVYSEPSARSWTPVNAPEPVIEEMVAQVNWTLISDRIQWLVDFGTRYSYALNHSTVAGALSDQFISFGFSPQLHSFQLNGSTCWNVVATQTGSVYPDSLIIVCGHFDSVSGDPYNLAPGADDNGTGTATVLVAAEILSQYDFEYSIQYICFSGEEQGLKGSQAYASWAAANNLGIVGVLNFDMLGYWEPGVEMDLEIEANEDSQWFAQAILNAADLYTDTPYELHVYNGAWWGDHASFWAEGFTAVNHEEAWDWGDPDFNPWYHTTSDLLMYVGEDFMVGNVKLAVGAVATLAVPVTGTGSSSESIQPVASFGLTALPNPFTTQVEFAVTSPLALEHSAVMIFDVFGRHIDTVEVGLSEGIGSASWAAGAEHGGSGVFFALLDNQPGVPAVRLIHLE